MPRVTLFTAPKPFTDPHIDLIQRNAIRSWMHLGDDVEILLIGDEEGLSEAASEFGLQHHPGVKRNPWGTPRVDSIFELARKATQSPILIYLNADIILLPNFINVVTLIDEMAERYLLVGQRWDLEVEEPLRFGEGWMDRVAYLSKNQGRLSAPTAMDYFVFPRELFKKIPPFAIGRAGWDNWMVYHAQKQGWPVIDITPSVSVVHQRHDYAHLPGGRPHYDLEESQQNVRLGGGFNKMYDLLDVDVHFVQGKISSKPLTVVRLLRKLERFLMPEEKTGWRWVLTRLVRRLRKRVMRRRLRS